MKRISLFIIALLSIFVLLSQTTETFDITTYQPPKGWKRTTGQGYVVFEDHKSGNNAGFCILVVYASRKSSGDADKDFQQVWKDLVVKPNGNVAEPKIEKEKTPEGWIAVTGVTTLKENNIEYALMLVTASGFGKVTSVLAKVIGESYMPVIETFLATMQLNNTVNNQNPGNTFTNEIIDNISLEIRPGWQINKQASYTQLTYNNTQQKSFCQATFYTAQPSTGDKQKDFGNEWKELVEKNFTVFTLASPSSMKTKKGNSFQRLGAKATCKNGNKYYVQLNVFDCDKSIQSVLIVSGSQQQLQQYDSSWQALITSVKKDNTGQKVMTAPTATKPVPPADKSMVGKWAKSASGPPQYQNGTLVNLVNSGYHKGQYDFKTDGTYSFHGESQFSSNDFGLTDEKGSYSVMSNKITLTPSTSSIRKLDANGNLKKSEQLPLAKRSYTWQLHYFEGINETNLVLSGINENMVDGGYGSVSQFPNSFLYSKEFLPEWRFKIQ